MRVLFTLNLHLMHGKTKTLGASLPPTNRGRPVKSLLPRVTLHVSFGIPGAKLLLQMSVQVFFFF